MSLPQTLTLSDQPKLDTEFTKGRFNNQVTQIFKKNTNNCLAIFFTTFSLGVKVRNMKMDFNTGGTWRRVGQ